MSYQKPNTGNSMNDYFTNLSTFYQLAPKLLAAKDPQNFEIWLDKLIQVDRRSLVLFIQKHEKEIPKEHMIRAKHRLSRWL